MVTQFLFLYGICHHFPFVVIRHGAHQSNLFAITVLRPQLLWYLPFVISNHLIRNVQNLFGASIVLFKFHHFYIVVIFLEQ